MSVVSISRRAQGNGKPKSKTQSNRGRTLFPCSLSFCYYLFVTTINYFNGHRRLFTHRYSTSVTIDERTKETEKIDRPMLQSNVKLNHVSTNESWYKLETIKNCTKTDDYILILYFKNTNKCGIIETKNVKKSYKKW